MYTSIYILNKAQLTFNHNKTPYELWFGRLAFVIYFGVFGSKCYTKRDDENLGKNYSKYDDGIFLVTHPTKRPMNATISNYTKLWKVLM